MSATVLKRPGPTEELDCELTHDEIKLRGEELAKQEKELEQLKGERSQAQKHFNKLIAEVVKVVARLSHDITRKAEKRKIKTEIQYDHTRATKSVIRLDTNAVIREEVMTDKELEEARQGRMFPASDVEAEENQALEDKAEGKEKSKRELGPGEEPEADEGDGESEGDADEGVDDAGPDDLDDEGMRVQHDTSPAAADDTSPDRPKKKKQNVKTKRKGARR